MAKRGATSELNHDNWDQEEPKDDENMIGSFARATPEQLQNRVIRSAKRRSVNPANSSSPSSPFTSFSGFGAKVTDGAPAKPNFSSLSGLGSGVKNGLTEQEKSKSTSDTPPVKGTADKKEPSSSSDYYVQLEGLNISVSKWISKHVSENPCCILTPVFRDYEKHLARIEQLKPQGSDNEEAEMLPPKKIKFEDEVSSDSTKMEATEGDKDQSASNAAPSTVSSTVPAASSSTISATPAISKTDEPSKNVEQKTLFGDATVAKTVSQTSSAPSFFQTAGANTQSVFGSLKTTSGSLFGNSTSVMDSGFKSSGLTFSFGSTASSAPSNATFQFGSGSTIGNGFSFAAQVAKATQEKQQKAETEAEEDQEAEEPPKVEFQPVEEEGSVYSIKCKVFVKKESEYKDRGVGMLYLKTSGESKTQLLVRTATTTGQILLNTLVTSDLRPARQGKNNVQIVCIPTPSDKSPAITLIRVKTSEDADELLAKINEHIR